MLKVEAAFVDLMAPQFTDHDVGLGSRHRRSRRAAMLGIGLAFSVGTITAFTGVKTTHTISGQLAGTAAVSGGNAGNFDIGYVGGSKSFTFSTGGASTGNQVIETIFAATKNTTTVLDLTGVLTNFIGDLLSTLSVIREIWFEYLTSAQDSVNGSNAAATATVKIKFGGSNPWNTGPLGADGFIYMKLGEKQMWQNNDATGWTVTNATGDKVDFVHGVNDYDAKFRITIIGEK